MPLAHWAGAALAPRGERPERAGEAVILVVVTRIPKALPVALAGWDTS